MLLVNNNSTKQIYILKQGLNEIIKSFTSEWQQNGITMARTSTLYYGTILYRNYKM